MAEPLNGVNERHTFVVKVSDKPGTLELIGATFAHRGVSLAATVGSDGSLGPDGHATITLHFSASERRKDVLRATLSRLNRVVSVHEIAPELVQAVALVRVAPDAGLPLTNAAVFPLPAPGREPVYRLIGTPEAVESAIYAWRTAGKLRSVSYGRLGGGLIATGSPLPPVCAFGEVSLRDAGYRVADGLPGCQRLALPRRRTTIAPPFLRPKGTPRRKRIPEAVDCPVNSTLPRTLWELFAPMCGLSLRRCKRFNPWVKKAKSFRSKCRSANVTAPNAKMRLCKPPCS